MFFAATPARPEALNHRLMAKRTSGARDVCAALQFR
jgi:hypothetical protein